MKIEEMILLISKRKLVKAPLHYAAKSRSTDTPLPDLNKKCTAHWRFITKDSLLPPPHSRFHQSKNQWFLYQSLVQFIEFFRPNAFSGRRWPEARPAQGKTVRVGKVVGSNPGAGNIFHLEISVKDYLQIILLWKFVYCICVRCIMYKFVSCA